MAVAAGEPNAQNHGDFSEGMPFLGGSLWIDFLNTRPVSKGVQLDFLANEQALESWTDAAGLSHEKPPLAGELDTLHMLRERLVMAFEQMSRGACLSGDVLEVVNALLERFSIRMRVSNLNGTPVVEREEIIDAPVLAVRIAADFARFAERYEAARLKHCENPDCTMVFYDRGKSVRRRWCSATVCGNRHKVASYRVRKTRQQLP